MKRGIILKMNRAVLGYYFSSTSPQDGSAYEKMANVDWTHEKYNGGNNPFYWYDWQYGYLAPKLFYFLLFPFWKLGWFLPHTYVDKNMFHVYTQRKR